MRINSNRNSIRVNISPSHEIKGILTELSKLHQMEFSLVDISSNGLGIIIPYKVEVNSKVKLTFGKPHLLIFEGVIIWCTNEEDKYRCGIKIEKGVSQLHCLYQEFRKKFEEDND